MSHPLIKRLSVYCDCHSPSLLSALKNAVAPFDSEVLSLPSQNNSFTEFWEANRHDYWPIVDCAVPKLNHFECFITDRSHVESADVAYALYARQIPVLSLAPRPHTATPLKSLSALFSDAQSLGVSTAEEALEKFLHFPQTSGRVFVIEGGDGAGKQTQVAMLVERLRSEGRSVETLDFPNDGSHYGVLIREVLAGKYGTLKGLDPKFFAALYSLNRYDTLPKLKLWWQRGCNIILDRYFTANFGYQASKFENVDERKQVIEQMKTFETVFLSLPSPTGVIYLDLSPAIAFRAMLADSTRRELDLHEKMGLEQKQKVRRSFLWCAEEFPEWSVVSCNSEDETVRFTRDDVHRQIVEKWASQFI